jgi:hypothetical protein
VQGAQTKLGELMKTNKRDMPPRVFWWLAACAIYLATLGVLGFAVNNQKYTELIHHVLIFIGIPPTVYLLWVISGWKAKKTTVDVGKSLIILLLIDGIVLIPTNNTYAQSVPVSACVSPTTTPLSDAEYQDLMAQLRDPFYMERNYVSRPTPDMAIWVGLGIVVVLGVATGYGLYKLCQAGGLITNSPPPVKRPPAPPNKNTPPKKVRALSLSYNTNGIFLQTQALEGVATFDATGLNELYGTNTFVDPDGSSYTTCSRLTIQQSGDNIHWADEVTVYVWRNSTWTCTASYYRGVLEESVLANSTSQTVTLTDLGEHLSPRCDVNARFFRLSSMEPVD